MGDSVVGANVVGDIVVGAMVVGATTIVGDMVVGAMVVGASVVGAMVGPAGAVVVFVLLVLIMTTGSVIPRTTRRPVNIIAPAISESLPSRGRYEERLFLVSSRYCILLNDICCFFFIYIK